MIWGFTGILGGLISIDANEITFFRTAIALLSLMLIGVVFPPKTALTRKQISWLIGTGIIVGLHWITFFYSIKISTISIGAVCMSASTLFTSFLEPLIFKRRYLVSELVLSLLVLGGIVAIFGFEVQHTWAIVIGLFSAFLSALFNVLNGVFVQTMPSQSIAKFEMLGGFATAFLFLAINGQVNTQLFVVSGQDWIFISILAIICTTFAFMTSIWVMKFVTPFTVSISVNMEPVYTVLIALWIDWYRGTREEVMTSGFYYGGAVIILAIFAHAYIKSKNRPVAVRD